MQTGLAPGHGRCADRVGAPPQKKNDKKKTGEQQKGKQPKTKKQKSGDSPAELKRKGIALVGLDVDFIGPKDGKTYGALIIGYRVSEDLFKVSYWCEGEVCNDVTRDLIQFTKPDGPRKLEGLVGMRVFITWVIDGEKRLYEAFVEKMINAKVYKLTYRDGDDLFGTNMSVLFKSWGLLANGELSVDDTPEALQTWSDY